MYMCVDVCMSVCVDLPSCVHVCQSQCFGQGACNLWKCTQCSEEGVNMCAGLKEALCPSLSPCSVQPSSLLPPSLFSLSFCQSSKPEHMSSLCVCVCILSCRLPDVWVNETERSQLKTKVVHLSQLPQDTAMLLDPNIYRWVSGMTPVASCTLRTPFFALADTQ